MADGVQAPRSPSLYDDDGDGYADFLWHDVPAERLRARRWSPADGGFASAVINRRITEGKNDGAYFTADMNGDGNADLLRVAVSGKKETLETYAHKTTARPHLVTRVTSGLGAVTEISYESLSRTEAYGRIAELYSEPATERCFPNWRWGSGNGKEVCVTIMPAKLTDAAAFYTALNDPWPTDENDPSDVDLTDPLTATAGDTPVLELMGPLYVVTRVDSSAPTAGNAGARSGVAYVYERGKVQAAGRGLLGFRALTTVDLQSGVRTTTTYRQDFPYIGAPLRTEVKTEDGHLLRWAQNTWRLQGYDASWNARTAASGDKVGTGSARLGPLQPHIAGAVEEEYDLPEPDSSGELKAGAKLTTVSTETTYDGWGNPSELTTTTVDHANGKRFQQVTENAYAASAAGEASTWARQYGRLTRTEVTRRRDESYTAGDETYESSASRASSFAYYTSDKKKGLLKSETREAATGTNAVPAQVTTYSYDAFGNRVRAKLSAGSATRCDTDTAVYDSAGRFVVEERDCLGRTVRELGGHNGWGQPTWSKRALSAAGAATADADHHYTPGGRRYASREADGSWTGWLRAWCASGKGCPATAVYYTETRQAGGGRAREYRDALGRVARAATMGFDGRWVYTDTDYDENGRVARRSEPYKAGSASAVYWTRYTYDLLGRVARAELPDYAANGANSVVTTAYGSLTTTTTNGKGQRRRVTRNALGETLTSAELVEANETTGPNKVDKATVTHHYDVWGRTTKSVTTSTDNKTATITRHYDLWGRMTKETDPARGAWTYSYNGFDELVERADAVGNRQTRAYDGLGRQTVRKDYAPGPTSAVADDVLAGTTAWTYDGAAYGLGQLQTVSHTAASAETRAYHYDSLGRVTQTTQDRGADGTYYSKQTYDEYGRPYQRFDAARAGSATLRWQDNVVETRYNANGYAHRWVDGMYVGGQPRRTYREIAGIDARGNVTQEKLGAGAVSVRRAYDAKTGRLASITGEDPLERTLQDQTYTWDIVGNLTERAQTLGKTTLEETFAYDSLNRLIQSKVAGETAQSVSYDGLGNITAKTGEDGLLEQYVYGDTDRPHRLTQAGSAHFVYDANGNVIQEHETGQAANPTRSFAYTPFNKAASIKQGTHTTEFEYGPDRSRTRRVDTVNTGAGTSVTTTLYFGGAEKVIAPDGSYTWKRYVADGFLIEQTYNSHDTLTKEDTRHLLKDHLGSIALILDEAGLDKDLLPLQRLSYDAWGQRRAPDDWTILARLTLSSPTHGAVTPYGYTGHEMLDAVGIIHMNGRIYDPKLGRFLQADPVIQFPNMAQNHNRYSYVLNNPLAYVDPSGYFIGKLLRKVVGVLINGTFGELLFSLVPQLRPLSTLFICASGNPALCAMAAAGNAYASGASLKQSLKAGVFAYVSAQAFAAVGDYFTGIEAVGGGWHWGAHALTGGILAELQGGEFGHGFLAAGVAFGVGRLGESQSWSMETQLAARAVSAGTVSEVTGGKFANGAMTAAFAYIFNELAQHGAVVDRRLTMEQRQYMEEGKVREFWESRLKSGDPIAQLALDVLDGKNSGRIALNRLNRFASQHGVELDNNEVSIEIMKLHAEVTATDDDGWLMPRQIAAYHHEVFEEYGLPANTFGGTPLTGALWEGGY